jgi:hypothetical protein
VAVSVGEDVTDFVNVAGHFGDCHPVVWTEEVDESSGFGRYFSIVLYGMGVLLY